MAPVAASTLARPRHARPSWPAAVPSGSDPRPVHLAQGFRPLRLRRTGLPRGEWWWESAGGVGRWVGKHERGGGGAGAPQLCSPDASRRCLRDGGPGDPAPQPSAPPSALLGGRTRFLAVASTGDSAVPWSASAPARTLSPPWRGGRGGRDDLCSEVKSALSIAFTLRDAVVCPASPSGPPTAPSWLRCLGRGRARRPWRPSGGGTCA